MLRIVELFLCFWAQMARRGGIVIVGLFIAGAVAAGWYAAGNLKVNTDTTQMLDTDLDFQKQAVALREAFPQIKDELAVIIRAPTIDEADAFAARLSARLAAQPSVFSDVYAPTADPFFLENGLLFLSEAELESRLSDLTRAAGLIETLINDPGIDTLFETIAKNDKLADRSDLGTQTLDRIYGELAAVTEAALDGKPVPFSWRSALNNEQAPEGGFIRIVNVVPVADFSRIQPIKPALAAMRTEIATLNTQFDGRTKALITGSLALRGEELASVTTGIGKSFALSFVLVSILLFIAFRSVLVSAFTIISLLITLTLTAAFAAYFFTELNLVSVAFTVLLVGLGLDFSIHLLLHVQEYRAKGLALRVALNSTLREIGGAMALAAPTTAFAFLSFLPTKFDGIAQLGAVAGVGVLIAFFVSVTFLPAMLAITPAPRQRPAKGTVRRSFSLMDTISLPIAAVAVIVGIGAITLLPKARFDADPMALRNPASESVVAFNMLFNDKDTVPIRLTRLAGSAADARQTIAKAETIDPVRTTRSLIDFIPEYQDEKLELIDFAAGSLAFVLSKPPATRTEPPDGSGVTALITRLEASVGDTGRSAQSVAARTRLLTALRNINARKAGGAQARPDTDVLPMLETRIFAYWPDLVSLLQGQFKADYIALDILPKSLRDRYLSVDGQWRVDFLPKADVREPRNLKIFVDEVEAVFPDIAGGAIQSEKAGQIIARSMMEASLFALVVITIMLFIFVPNPVTVVLMLFPLGLAAILTIATGVLVDVPFNYANVIVLPLLMGIGIDSGIHLVLRQRKLKRKIDHADASSVYATATPRAVLFSALTTVASFGSLTLSAHRGTASMGELLSISIGFTLVCTLIVLPAVFRFREKRSSNGAV
ncbi:MAG: MMPL family transporter [Pseudomonadota bacterium]